MNNEVIKMKMDEFLPNYLNYGIVRNLEVFYRNYDEFELISGSDTYDLEDYAILNGYETEEEISEITEDDLYIDFINCYIITPYAAKILINHTDEAVYYSETLDLYVWALDVNLYPYTIIEYYPNKEQDTMKDNEGT